MRRVVPLVLVLALCASLSACGSSSPSRADSVDASIVAAALTQKSVHWTEFQNMCHVRRTADVTTNSGRELITIGVPGCGAKGKAQIVLVDDVAYIRGNPAGLRSEYTIFLPPAKAEKYAGRWLAIPKGETLYTQMADSLTLASIVHNADLEPSTVPLVIRKKSPGTALVVLNTGGFMTLSAHAHGNPLPVAMTRGACPEWCYSGSFSKWNEPVSVRAPAQSTPIETVCGRCSYSWPAHG
jgi:hypothetical protein